MYKSLLRTSTRQLASARKAAIRGYAAHATPQPFDWEDPLNSKSLYTEEELAISETAEAYCQERMLPRVLRKPFYQVSREVANICHRGISRRTL
jgi:glutaryl-CoA dehydrogenase